MIPSQETIRRRIAAAMQDDDEPQLGSFMRELCLSGGHAKLTMPSTALRAALAASTRDLNSQSASAGAYLIGTASNPMEELIRGAELGDLGVTVRAGLAGPATVPRATALPTGVWIAADSTAIPESQPAFGQLAVTPHYLACTIDVSRQLAMQSEPGIADAVVGPLLVESFRRSAFTALFSGTGSSGAPRGLLSTVGIGVEPGTSISNAGLRAMLKRVLIAGAREANVRYVADPATADTIGSREFSAGSGLPLWYDGKVQGRPAISTSLMPTGTIACGDFSRATLWMFDKHSVGLELDPFSSFASGLIRFRLLIPLDFTFSPADAFAVATSVT